MTLTDIERDYLTAAGAGDIELAARLAEEVDAAHEGREARLNAPGARREAALWYASHGIAVFPCAPGEKRPATEHGFKDATTDADRIRAWWKVADYNVGLPTGHRFDVVDLDGPQGLLAYGDLLDAGGALVPLAVALTPRGRHYYVLPTGAGNGANVGGMPKVDYRGAGGYVIAPPSRTPAGTYRWSVGRELNPAAFDAPEETP